jgi:DNA-binding winged helix-turn-helix (wHTH) protein
MMHDHGNNPRYRFGLFELDPVAQELRRRGARIKLTSQPFQLLTLLVEQPGVTLTRDEIAHRLWPEDTFVDFDHGVNAAINRIREALGDTAKNPRFVETIARQGYRFIAPVEVSTALAGAAAQTDADADATHPLTLLATEQDLPKGEHVTAQRLFLLLQLLYLGFYIGALANLAEINELIEPVPAAWHLGAVILLTAAILIPVRAFLVTAALFRAPRFKERFLRLWTFLLLVDLLWALSPFLLLHHMNYGLAAACAALLVYSPFAQRSLVLMGAGKPKP